MIYQVAQCVRYGAGVVAQESYAAIAIRAQPSTELASEMVVVDIRRPYELLTATFALISRLPLWERDSSYSLPARTIIEIDSILALYAHRSLSFSFVSLNAFSTAARAVAIPWDMPMRKPAVYSMLAWMGVTAVSRATCAAASIALMNLSITQSASLARH